MKREGLTVVVILLFIGLALSPSIYAETIPVEVYVEYSVEVCGLPGLTPKTIKLTQEQAEEVETIFENRKELLDSSTSIEKTIQICKNVIVELDRYGLLGGLSVQQAQRMITWRFQHLKYMSLLNRFDNQLSANSSLGKNEFCLIVGSTTDTKFEGIYQFAYDVLFYWTILYDYPLLILPCLFIALLWDLTTFISPIMLGTFIYFGENTEGWVNTYLGLNGSISWNGSLRNGVDLLFGFSWAVVGFIGIKLWRYSEDSIQYSYLGWAMDVGIRTIDTKNS